MSYNNSIKENTPCGVGKACQPSATHLCDRDVITQTLYTRVLYFRAYHSTMEYQKSSVSFSQRTGAWLFFLLHVSEP